MATDTQLAYRNQLLAILPISDNPKYSISDLEFMVLNKSSLEKESGDTPPSLPSSVSKADADTAYAPLNSNTLDSYIIGGSGGSIGSVSQSVFIGKSAGAANTTGSQNVFIGYQTGQSNTEINGLVAIGDRALRAWNGIGVINTSAIVAVGESALASLVGPDGSGTALGGFALLSCTTGGINTAVGCSALQNLTTANACTAVGDAAGAAIISGSYNTIIGRNALSGCTTGQANTALGFQAGIGPDNANTITGAYNTWIGTSSGPLSTAAQADPSYAVGVGYNTAAAYQGTAVGEAATALGYRSTALGSTASAHAGSWWSLALGYGTVCGDYGCVAIGTDSGGTGATSTVANRISLGTANHTTQILGLPAFTAGCKYVVADASGILRLSTLGPVS